MSERNAIQPWSGPKGPAGWGLGDGQAIPWEYAPAPEARDLVTVRPRYGLFIGGREVPASDGATFQTVDPSTEKPLAEVARAITSTQSQIQKTRKLKLGLDLKGGVHLVLRVQTDDALRIETVVAAARGAQRQEGPEQHQNEPDDPDDGHRRGGAHDQQPEPDETK